MADDSAKPNLYWSLASDGLLAILHSASDGLNTAAAPQHLAQFRPNLLRAREKWTIFPTQLLEDGHHLI